jgi:hypothetical protein
MPKNYSGVATETIDSFALQTTTFTGRKVLNPGDARGMYFTAVVTNAGTAPTLVIRLEWSPDNGTTWVAWDTTNLQTTSKTTTGVYTLKVYPGIATAANTSLNDALPPVWRAVYTIGGTTPQWTLTSYATYLN